VAASRLHLAALVAVLCALAAAPAASARTETVGKDESLAFGPRLAGGEALWLSGRTGTVSIEAGRGGGALFSTTLSSSSDDETGEFDQTSAVSFSASASHLLLDTARSSGSSKYRQYDLSAQTMAVLRSAGSPQTIGQCSVHVDAFIGDPQVTPPTPGSALDGTIAVAKGCPRATVRDLATGQVLRELPALGRDVRLAGRYVASRIGNEIVVYDWQAGQEAYRFPLAAPTAGFDLGADGAVATVQFPGALLCETGKLRRHSAAAPTGVELPVAPCTTDVELDAGKAAIVAGAVDSASAVVIAEVAADGARRDLAWLGTGRRRVGGLDYAGGTAAFALRDCAGAARILRAQGEVDRPATECAGLRISAARIRGRTLRVTGGAAADFSGPLRLVLRLRVGRRIRRIVRTVQVNDGAFSLSTRLPAWARARRAARFARISLTFRGNATYLSESRARSVRRT
jgi:hypothetical protein